jgi:hypothetical protein
MQKPNIAFRLQSPGAVVYAMEDGVPCAIQARPSFRSRTFFATDTHGGFTNSAKEQQAEACALNCSTLARVIVTAATKTS